MRASWIGTPCGEHGLVPAIFAVPLWRTTWIHFYRTSKRQLRWRLVNIRGKVKRFGHQHYLARNWAGERVLVRMNGDIATIYHGTTVMQKRVGLWNGCRRILTCPGTSAIMVPRGRYRIQEIVEGGNYAK